MQLFKKYLENGIKIIKEKGPYLGALGLLAAGSIFGAAGCAKEPPLNIVENRIHFKIDNNASDSCRLVDIETVRKEYDIDKLFSKSEAVFGPGLIGDVNSDGYEELLLVSCEKPYSDDFLNSLTKSQYGVSRSKPESMVFFNNYDAEINVRNMDRDKAPEIFTWEATRGIYYIFECDATGIRPLYKVVGEINDWHTYHHIYRIFDRERDGKDEIAVITDSIDGETKMIIKHPNWFSPSLYVRESEDRYVKYAIDDPCMMLSAIIRNVKDSPIAKSGAATQTIKMTPQDEVFLSYIRNLDVQDEEGKSVKYDRFVRDMTEEMGVDPDSSFGKDPLGKAYRLLMGYETAENLVNENTFSGN